MNRVKELRTAKGWRQADLAGILNTKPQTISRYEKGERDIDSATISRLCDIFGCSADYLLGRSDLPTYEISPEEAQLLLALREADDRTLAMVRLALEPYFPKEKEEEKAI
jgi:transcriptional regulator with XRE-family HTH domain